MSLSLCSSRTFLLKGKFITCKQNFYSAEVRSYRKLIKSGRLRVFVFLIALPVYSLPASDPNIHGAVALEFRETAYPTDRAPRYDKPATAGPGGRNTPGWHLSDKLIVPPNITLVPLRPNAPNSNPVENVWQFIRDNWLSNRVVRSYDDILQHCCFAWNKLVDQPWTIMSIGLRDWAQRF